MQLNKLPQNNGVNMDIVDFKNATFKDLMFFDISQLASDKKLYTPVSLDAIANTGMNSDYCDYSDFLKALRGKLSDRTYDLRWDETTNEEGVIICDFTRFIATVMSSAKGNQIVPPFLINYKGDYAVQLGDFIFPCSPDSDYKKYFSLKVGELEGDFKANNVKDKDGNVKYIEFFFDFVLSQSVGEAIGCEGLGWRVYLSFADKEAKHTEISIKKAMLNGELLSLLRAKNDDESIAVLSSSKPLKYTFPLKLLKAGCAYKIQSVERVEFSHKEGKMKGQTEVTWKIDLGHPTVDFWATSQQKKVFNAMHENNQKLRAGVAPLTFDGGVLFISKKEKMAGNNDKFDIPQYSLALSTLPPAQLPNVKLPTDPIDFKLLPSDDFSVGFDNPNDIKKVLGVLQAEREKYQQKKLLEANDSLDALPEDIAF